MLVFLSDTIDLVKKKKKKKSYFECISSMCVLCEPLKPVWIKAVMRWEGTMLETAYRSAQTYCELKQQSTSTLLIHIISA